VTTADVSLKLPTEVARALIGAPVNELEPSGCGRNSRVYRVRSGRRVFALKRYPGQHASGHDRLATEVDALRLLRQHGFGTVPDVLAVDYQHGFALLSWIDGSPVTEVSAADIDQAVAFLDAIHMLRQTPSFGRHRHAAEACLSGVEIEQQIGRRLEVLQTLSIEESLQAFLEESFSPAFVQLLARARARMREAGLDFDAMLPEEMRTLVPSDFGFHNSLRRPGGSLAFFDFEYFGWDDPVKLTADVLLHPGTAMPFTRRQQFRCAAENLYDRDTSFRARLDALYPLFGLRWALILLNEFLPDRWRQRVTAGMAESWSVAKERQLARAREYAAKVTAATT
jgi:hypothetical protein